MRPPRCSLAARALDTTPLRRRCLPRASLPRRDPAAMSTSGTVASVNGTSSVLPEPARRISRRSPAPKFCTATISPMRLPSGIDGSQPDQVGMVGTRPRPPPAAGRDRRRSSTPLSASAALRSPTPSSRATTPLAVARALRDLERPRAALVEAAARTRPMSCRRHRVGVDHHLAADAMRA